VTDKLRSAPVALLDQGGGAMPAGHGHPAPGSLEPQKIVGAPPRSKWSAAAGLAGGVDPQESGARDRPRPAAGSQIGGSAPRGRRPTLGWLDGRGVSVTFTPPWRCGGAVAASPPPPRFGSGEGFGGRRGQVSPAKGDGVRSHL